MFNEAGGGVYLVDVSIVKLFRNDSTDVETHVGEGLENGGVPDDATGCFDFAALPGALFSAAAPLSCVLE
jgi:hypothetical protein